MAYLYMCLVTATIVVFLPVTTVLNNDAVSWLILLLYYYTIYW